MRYLESALSIVGSICEQETDAMENCPENLQNTTRYETMEATVENLE